MDSSEYIYFYSEMFEYSFAVGYITKIYNSALATCTYLFWQKETCTVFKFFFSHNLS